MKRNGKEGKACRLCSTKLNFSKFPVLFSFPPSFLIFHFLPTHVFCKGPFQRHTTHLFSSELDFSLTKVCVSPEEGCEIITSEPQRRDTLASGRASIIESEQIFLMCQLQLEEWPEWWITLVWLSTGARFTQVRVSSTKRDWWHFILPGRQAVHVS